MGVVEEGPPGKPGPPGPEGARGRRGRKGLVAWAWASRLQLLTYLCVFVALGYSYRVNSHRMHDNAARIADIRQARTEGREAQAEFNTNLCNAVALVIKQQKRSTDPKVAAGILKPLRDANPDQYDELIRQATKDVADLERVRNRLRC